MKMSKQSLIAVSALFLTGFLISFGFTAGVVYQQKIYEKKECGVSKKAHTVTIEKDRFKPTEIRVKRCDTLTFLNADDKLHSAVFGTHDNHVPYGDFAQEYLLPKERISLRLFQSGSYLFHDHLHEEIKGRIIIAD